jgi:hypothetical protein
MTCHRCNECAEWLGIADICRTIKTVKRNNYTSRKEHLRTACQGWCVNVVRKGRKTCRPRVCNRHSQGTLLIVLTMISYKWHGMLSCNVIYVTVYCTQLTLREARICELQYIIRPVLHTRTLVFRRFTTDAWGFVGDLQGFLKHISLQRNRKI